VPDIKYVVVLMQENRSFDEYFGTFPGAAGFNDTNNAQAFNQPWGTVGTLQPFRKSTFTGTGLMTQQLGHDWITMHTAVQDGAAGAADNMNFFLSQTIEGWGPQAANAPMSYFVANDIPYHWALAQYFTLCDNYFSSALAGTEANRLFLAGGTNYDPATFTPGTSQVYQSASDSILLYNTAGQVSWQSYLADLHEWSVSNPGKPSLYQLYDDSNWQFGWSNTQSDSTGSVNPFTNYSPYTDSTGKTIWLGNAIPSSTIPSGGQTLDPNCQAPNVYGAAAVPLNPPPIADDPRPLFAQHVLPDPANPNDPASQLATLTWIVPPYQYSEHPPYYSYLGDGSYSPATGALYIAYIVDALMQSQFWPQTVLIVTYDETDTQFDHVPPPLNKDSSLEPLVFESPLASIPNPDAAISYNAPIGGGMRVPAIIVSPMTIGKGVCHAAMDHTSILRLMADVSKVQCKNGTNTVQPSPFRTAAFADLSDVIANLAELTGTAPPPLPSVATVSQILQNAIARFNAQGGAQYGKGANPPDLTPPSPIPHPVTQSIELIVPIGSYDLAQVMKLSGGQPTVTIPDAIQVVLYGFEPDELTNAMAVGAITNGLATAAGSTAARIPTLSFSNPNIAVDTTNISISPDPAAQMYQPGNWQSGVPVTFTVSYPIVLSNFAALFPGMPTSQTPAVTAATVAVSASLQIDAAFTSGAELEFVSVADPQFYHDFTDDTSWLSAELRVFSVEAGGSLFGVPLDVPTQSNDASQVALSFITNLLNTMNQNQGQNLPATIFPPGSGITVSSFDTLNQIETVNPLYLTETDENGKLIFNFALARVHLNSQSPANGVRVFFRCCRASVTTGAYDATGPTTGPTTATAFYRSNPATGPGTGPQDVKVPLFGVMNVPSSSGGALQLEYVNIPFFAVPRIDPKNQSMALQPRDDPNVLDIAPGSVKFFGCWLDINQTQTIMPPSVPASSADWDGPWSAVFPAGTQYHTIAEAFATDMHQCLVAEISYDAITIPPNDTPGQSAWLAQRNLGFSQ